MRGAALAKALLLGDGAQIEPEQRDAWADAGIAHILAVSGLHVSLVARAAMFLATRLLRAGRRTRACLPIWPDRLAAWLALAPVWAYVALAGAGISSLRAGCMATMALLARAAGYGGQHARHALALTALALLASDPLAALSPSAPLSFVSVAVLLAQPADRRALPPAKRGHGARAWPGGEGSFGSPWFRAC